MKVAIFGGAFNPVHKEHVNIALSAVRELELDKIIIMPSAVSPHKSGKLVASGQDRIEMCRLAFKDVPHAEISDYEISKGGISYSYLTCEEFAREYPAAERYFIIGADMLSYFPRWMEPEKILSNVTLASCAREDREEFNFCKSEVEARFGVKVKSFSYVGEKVSSTHIRTLAALGEKFDGYVMPDVCQYIIKRGLYSLGDVLKVKDFLTEERWAHSVRVAFMCAENASRARVTEEQAITMSALHDCAKYLPLSSPYLKGFECPKGVPPPVVHQFSGAYLAEHYFGITDRTQLDAIKYHASGRADMTDAEVLLYLCDMLEEGRSFEGVGELRAYFYKDLRLCMYEALKRQLVYLAASGKPVYGLTREAYEFLKDGYQ